MSVTKAICWGLLVVNGPVAAFLFGPILGYDAALRHGMVGLPRQDQNELGFLVMAFGFVLAWLWWALAVPHWRIWAYERVEDLQRLDRAAVGVGLTWRKGHVFSRTELKTRAMERREQELSRRRWQGGSEHRKAPHGRRPSDA
jgi:hypothetical protein